MDLTSILRKSAALPLRTAAFGVNTATAVAAISLDIGVATARTAVSGGFALATLPVQAADAGLLVIKAVIDLPSAVESAVGLALENVGGAQLRRCYRCADRAWIEVRGLDRADGAKVGDAVLAAVRKQPGVAAAQLNCPLARVVVEFGEDPPATKALCAAIAAAEDRARVAPASSRSHHLPGDEGMVANRLLSAGITAAGLSGALAGRALRLPRLPITIGAAVSVVNYQPWLRRMIEDRLGRPTADKAIGAAALTARTVGQVPGSLAVGVVSRVIEAAESRAGQRAWEHFEPLLARYVECFDTCPEPGQSAPRGPVERHLGRSAVAQAVSAAAMGILTGNPNAAASGALIAVPKAAHRTRESFAGNLGRGLANDHHVLPLRPSAWRKLDRVDTVVFDPRALRTAELRISDIRGASDEDRIAVWERAYARLAADTLTTGWHPIEGPWASGQDDVEVLVGHTLDPMATSIVAEARRSGTHVVSVDDGDIGDLLPAFDDVEPLDGASLDEALAGAVASLHTSGRTVAVISTGAHEACASADVAIGVLDLTCPAPWYADVLVDDMAAVWRILHAIPAARTASERGVEIATGASVLGALLMVPGVGRGRGPGPITAGAAAGQWTGYRLARQALRATPPAPAPTHDWHAMSPQEVRRRLPAPGDTAQRAEDRQNAAWQAFVRARSAVSGFSDAMRKELSDPLTPVLATGAAASAMLGSPVDAILVGSVLFGNAALAATQRIHAERLLGRLLAVQVPKARKVRAGGGDDGAGRNDYQELPADGLRHGEIIEIRADEVVPADARLIEAVDVEVDESSLTGESLPVVKQVDATPGAPLAERSCMLFAGSTVVAGTAVAIVTAVGPQTEANRASELAQTQTSDVGLQSQLHQLTKRVWPVSLAGGALVTGLGVLRRTRLRDAVSSGVAVSVSAVPEGLPLVATLAQQASARRLAKIGALVRSPRSVEALGRVDVVCFDKTGTLSENRLRVTRIHCVGTQSENDVVARAAIAAPPSNGGPPQHATDTAIVEAAEERCGGIDSERTAHLAFRSGRSYSASLVGATMSVKGAPEVVLPACEDLEEADRRMVDEMAARGLRVIAVASRDLGARQVDAAREDPEVLAEHCRDGLHLAGLLGIADTPRADAADVLADLADRDVAIRLITGDHPATATAIAAALGLRVDDEQVITGPEWAGLSRQEQEKAVTDGRVFARVSPEHKVQIVQTLERTGRVCAMVGDGVNDAAAIRAATVGVGVASHGSAPARTAADVMLLDGRIEALLDALDEGHRLWQRVTAAVAVLLGGNAGEVLFAIIGSALTGRAPLNARQLLLVNMLTDALPAAALAVSPPSAGHRPTSWGPDDAALWRTVAVRGVATAGAATGAWTVARMTGRRRRADTVGLIALVAAQLGQTLIDSRGRLVVLTALGSLAAMGVAISTPGISQLLGCTPIGPVGWTQALFSATVATGAAAVAQRMIAGPGEVTPRDTLEF